MKYLTILILFFSCQGDAQIENLISHSAGVKVEYSELAKEADEAFSPDPNPIYKQLISEVLNESEFKARQIKQILTRQWSDGSQELYIIGRFQGVDMEQLNIYFRSDGNVHLNLHRVKFHYNKITKLEHFRKKRMRLDLTRERHVRILKEHIRLKLRLLYRSVN